MFIQNDKLKEDEMTIKANGYSNRVRKTKKTQRRLEGEQRNMEWRKLSTAEKIKSLKSRCGKSAKQLAKLDIK